MGAPDCTACPANFLNNGTTSRPRRCTYQGGHDIDGIQCGYDIGLGSTWEANMRLPAIVRWPGHVQGGSVSFELVSSLDMLPTVLGLAGIPLPTDRVLDGQDMLPI